MNIAGVIEATSLWYATVMCALTHCLRRRSHHFLRSISFNRSLDEATQFMAQFEVGMRIPIRVCPTNPKLSVIEPGFDPRGWLPLVVALMFIFVGLSVVTHPTRIS